MGLDYISLGKLKLRKKEKKQKVLDIFKKSLAYLRQSNQKSFIIEGLIERAKAFIYYESFKEGREDLIEAYDLIVIQK